MYEVTARQEATPARLKAVVALNRALGELVNSSLISDDKASDLVSDAIYLLNLPYEGTEDENIEELFWEEADKAGVL